MVVELGVSAQRVIEVFIGVEMSGFQDLGDAAIETLDHAVGLWTPGLDQPMVDVLLLAKLVKRMPPRGLALAGGAEPIGELLASAWMPCCTSCSSMVFQ